ncbi:hypothetical protein A2U01_0108886, partial [Trifolium medium]|nr:hypothetical protein [Trifolium medium]
SLVAGNGNGDGEHIWGRGAGKHPPYIPRPVDIPTDGWTTGATA